MVMVEGVGLAGVAVEMSGDEVRDATTDANGRFTFSDVPTGAYVVSIRGYPSDASFSSTSRTAVIGREAGRRLVTLDFLGSFIRTSAIRGTVTSRDRALAGVTVRAEGPDTTLTTTDGDGAYNLSGLRRGSYAVTISGFPGNVSFPATESEVQVETGETATADFEGEPELTATVTITSLRRELPSGATETVDPDDFRGRVEVEVMVDRGEDTPEAVRLFLGDELVGQQLFNPDEGPVRADARVQDAAESSFTLTFSVRSDEFDPETGEARFTNGETDLRATLATREGGDDIWTSVIPVRLTNRDTFLAHLDPQRGPTAGPGGEEWIGGDLGVQIRPVIYNEGRVVTSVTLEIRRSGGAALRARGVGGEAPFHTTFPGSGAADSTNVAGYQTPTGATDQVRVRSARYGDGDQVAGLPVVVAEDLRIDNVPPPGGRFELPEQGAGEPCCLGNWVGAEFRFQDAFEGEADTGVGGETVSFHVGPAQESDQELAARPAVERGADVPASAGNTAYRAVAVYRDALDNRRVIALEPSAGNSLASERGGLLGIDRTPPEVRFASAAVADRTVHPDDGSTWRVRAEDEASGFSSMPARATVRRFAPGLDGVGSCPFPGTSACRPTPDDLNRAVPSQGDGYFVYQGRVLDRAGNLSSQLTRWVLRDTEAPEVEGVLVEGGLEAGGTVQVEAPASDNVDLHRAVLRHRFQASGGEGPLEIPLVSPDTLGARFDGSPVGTATARWTAPVVASAEGVTGNDAPNEVLQSLAAFSVIVHDAAGHGATGERSVGVPSTDTAPLSFSVSERGEAEGVGRWVLEAQGSSVCAPRSDRADGGSCDQAPDAVILNGTASGQSGSFEDVFEVVHFFARVDGTARWLGSADVSEMTVDEGGATGRSWRWSLEWIPEADFSGGTHPLVAVGLDGRGNALVSGALGTVTVVPAH